MIGIREVAWDRAWGHMFKIDAAVKEQTILHGEDAESRPMHQPSNKPDLNEIFS